MGKRGPAKTPTHILKMRGSWRANEREGEPEAEPGHPPRPDALSEDAALVWDQVCDTIDGIGVLAVTDGAAIARYCEMFVRWWRANEFVQKNGETYPQYHIDKDGNTLRNENGNKIIRMMRTWPQVAILSDLSTQLLRLEQQFGLTPAARAGLKVESKPVPAEDKGRFFA